MNCAKQVQAYIDGVLGGKILACREHRAAVQRHVDDLKRAGKKNSGIHFNQSMAEVAIEFMPLLSLTTSTWAGRPFVPEPWQMFVIWSLFGWRRANGTRRFREAYITVARGNGKSTFAAAIMLLLFILDGETRSECYCVATKKDQARLVFNDVRRMLSASEALQQCEAKITEQVITLPDESTCLPIGSDSKTTDGLQPHAIVVDEFHEWRRQHRGLWEKICTAMHKRPQPLLLIITTAGDDHSDLWKEQDDYSARVARQEVQDDRHFSLIFRLDPEDDHWNPTNWQKANPSLGAYVSLEALQEIADKARQIPSEELAFKRYYCNIRVEALIRMIPDQLWALGDKPLPILSGHLCHGGLDLGTRDDLASFSLMFPPQQPGQPHRLKSWSWIPREGPRDLQAEPWAGWIRDGLLEVTEGNTTDDEAIIHRIKECRRTYMMRSVGLDPDQGRFFGAKLVTMGLSVWEMQQNCRNYNEPIREFLKLLRDGKIHHGGDQLLAFAARNMVGRSDGEGRMMPTKSQSRDKIDPLVSGLIGFNECLFWSMRSGNNGTPTIRTI